jgi:hypothetical protein
VESEVVFADQARIPCIGECKATDALIALIVHIRGEREAGYVTRSQLPVSTRRSNPEALWRRNLLLVSFFQSSCRPHFAVSSRLGLGTGGAARRLRSDEGARGGDGLGAVLRGAHRKRLT